MKIDKELLVQQIKFLYSYPWREQGIPDEVVGVINLLEAIEEEENEQDLNEQLQDILDTHNTYNGKAIL